MNPTIINEQQHHILFDSDALNGIVPQWFEIEYWQPKAQVIPAARGRGRAWFIETTERAMVLRHYQRGGLMARLLGDKYFWRELAQTRAWREWHLLAYMRQQDLPVPQPLAAHVQRTGWFYRADLLTACIEHSQSLSVVLSQAALADEIWLAIGRMIKRFHNANIFHADMNAHNILLDANQAVYLIDFDKGRLIQDNEKKTDWTQATLQRLQRSLNKLRFEDVGFQYSDRNWQVLLEGYQAD